MKQKLFITTLTICLITFGSYAANAQYPGGMGYGPPTGNELDSGEDDWRGHHRQNRHEMIGELLGLSEEQEEQIDAIREKQWNADKILREKMREYREQMLELADTTTFDEEAIRALAEEQAKLQVELAVAKARMHSQIHAIMTPDQQDLAKKLRAVRQNRKDRRGKSRRSSGN